MKNIFFVIVLLIATSAIADEPRQFFSWTDSSGVISYTDNMDSIPKKYQDQTEVIEIDGLQGFERITTVLESTYAADLEARLARLSELNAPLPTEADVCAGHVTVRKVRVQEGDYNRTKVIATDECGRVLSVSGQYPEIRINR